MAYGTTIDHEKINTDNKSTYHLNNIRGTNTN